MDDYGRRLSPLTKAKSSGPPSLPSVLNGRIGIWRTVRGNRMFIELKGAAFRGLTEESLKNMSTSAKKVRFGKYFDDNGRIRTDQEDLIQGQVLDGPADFVGKDVTSLGSEQWRSITPEATNKEFSGIEVHRDGIKALKTSIRRAVGDESDTRLKRLRTANTVESLVPIARVSGFKDDVIKDILTSGKPSDDTIQTLTIESRAASRLRPSAGAQSAFEGAAAVQLDSVISEVERAGRLRPSSLKNILESMRDSSEDKKVKKDLQALLDKLKVSSGQKDMEDIASSAINIMQRDLMRSDYPRRLKPSSAKDRLSENRRLTQESIDNDKQAVESAISSTKSDAALDELANEYLAQVGGDKDKARQLALEYILGQLEGTVRLPQVRREVAKVRRVVSSGGTDRLEVLFLLIQILRLILTVLLPV